MRLAGTQTGDETMNANNKYPQLVVAKQIAAEEFRRDITGAMVAVHMLVWSEIHQTVRRVTFTRDQVLGSNA